MKKIENIIQQLDRLNYFQPWREILFGEQALHYWEILLHQSTNIALCKKAGEYFDLSGVPFVITTEYIESFFRYAPEYIDKKYTIQDSIAKAYLIRRLENDNKMIQTELDKKLLVTLEKNRELINAHLLWMQSFIRIVNGEDASLELDPTCCTVGKWLQQNRDNPVYRMIDKKHQYLHALAQSALRMYEKKEYAFFLLPYMDIVAYSYSIRDTLMHFYFVEHLDSIYIDPLSGLPNYLQLFHTIEANNDTTLSLFVFNISEFRHINLMYGHKVGNKVIKEVAKFLENRLEQGFCYRIYADEFAMILPTEKRDNIVRELKEAIETHVFNVDNRQISLKIYGSIATLNQNVLELCEYGLIMSDEQHGAVVNVDKIQKKELEQFASRISFQQKIRLAFLDNRILIYYQPIMQINENSVYRYEALMRLEDDQGKILPPAHFLDTLKKMYIYPEVTKFILQRTFAFFKTLPYQFSINLSYSDIQDANIQAFIFTLLKENKETAKRCMFELTESEAVHNLEEINDFFIMVREYGVKIAIDDFGAGYSNYDLIFNLELDYIKIDGSLIKNLLHDQKSEIMVSSIVTLAHEKGANVIAEWVSNEMLLNKVKSMGIELAQGYHLGKPERYPKPAPSTV